MILLTHECLKPINPIAMVTVAVRLNLTTSHSHVTQTEGGLLSLY